MKLIKNFSPKRLFGSKKERSKVTRSDPPSFASSSSSSAATPTSVLPRALSADDWPSDFSSDMARHSRVSRKQLEALLGLSGADPPSHEEVAAMLSELDRHGDGVVSVEALMSHVGGACDEDLRETFEIFDADGDGRITAEELFSVFVAIGEEERCTLEDCRRMIAGVDKNGDGFVCFEDFARMMDHHHHR
ncbi:probable calcium-binding protein CML35 [Momordica charantia]|uniref:Probable calcium-binding protein CML35 n=1 Tax=Momordica charantia TaxID=3673 RepID=A0A6J1DP84_MOMCH|nr:probable calcium-binding protein CML35 [Momordica charantia]